MSEQMTNEADSESIRATRQEDGTIVVEACPCDGDGHEQPWGVWTEIARREPDGSTWYADERGGSTWTESRTYTVNDLLRMI